MGRYDTLRQHLDAQHATEVELGFEDLERIIGGSLPKAAGRPAFWASEVEPTARARRCRTWTEAGFNASLTPGRKRVRFLRQGCKVVSRREGVTFIAKENPSEEEIAQARQAWESLIKLLARTAADASHKLGITFDMDDPQVACDLMEATFDGVFGLGRGQNGPARTARRAG